MPLIKYTNKGFLREHPQLDPISQPTPVQTHSYIFPGDELVLYHVIDLPTDASAALMTDIKFVSARVSLIAQKPNIFVEEFNQVFASTRHFELDSFSVSFNNLNAKVIPWGTDGYAANVTLQQDRSWKLPPGDFRRQINLFTTHPSSSLWKYYFTFPVLFRWEYWQAMINADNDFYNNAQAQNGQNQFWQHYFDPTALPFGWIIKSRLELNILVNGVATIIRNDLNLTPGSDDINDYNSNTDWINKSIKTTEVLGTPSNTPCLVYGNRHTEVWGYFDKVSAWGVSEQGNISAVVWIEPFEGGGIGSRTRASSLYPVGSETVFSGLNTSLTDDSGLGITDGSGNYIVIDNAGAGAIVIFDGINPEKVKVFALIDYNKLNAVYPGITKFTLYVRLYNSTVIGGPGTFKKGEEIKQDCVLVSPLDANTLCDRSEPLCPFNLDVFADTGDSDELKNDKSDFYQYGDALISAITLKLQKADNNCDDVWTDKATITDSTYGLFFAFGDSPDFSGDSFEDDYAKKYTGLFLDWRTVLTAFGAGRYRMQIIKTDVFSNAVTTYDPRTFCLRAYHCNLANGTVRIETVNIGERGSFFDPVNFIDYAGGWRGQIRLKGVIKYKSSPYVKEFNQYGSASFNKKKPIINEQNPKFTLAIKPIPGWMDFVLSTDVLQADEIYITDYNSSNRHELVKLPVNNDGDFSPRDNNLQNPLSDVEISLEYALNSLRRRNSQ